MKRIGRLRIALSRVTRDALGRFVRIEALRQCVAEDCGLDDPVEPSIDWRQQFREVDAVLDTLGSLIESDDPALIDAGRQVLHDYRLQLRADEAEISTRLSHGDNSLIRDAFEDATGGGSTGPEFIDTEVDSMDVSGLEPGDARRLALRLVRWNPGVRHVYSRRLNPFTGKQQRFIAAGVTRVDLNDSVMQELGLDIGLRAIVQDRGIRITRE